MDVYQKRNLRKNKKEEQANVEKTQLKPTSTEVSGQIETKAFIKMRLYIFERN